MFVQEADEAFIARVYSYVFPNLIKHYTVFCRLFKN